MFSIENKLGKDYCCSFNSVQSAIQACLELLGTTVSPIPVIMPVTAPPDTLSAVLRAGGHPVLLDIGEDLQINVEQLKTILEEFKTAIVLLTRPIGQLVNKNILDLVQDYPTVLDSRLFPSKDLSEDDLCCTFNIFDLSQACDAGSVVIHKFKNQIKQLKLIRSGILGMDAALPTSLDELACDWLDHSTNQKIFDSLKLEFTKQVKNAILSPKWVCPIYIKVKNAKVVAASLIEAGFNTQLAVYPLYKLDEVNQRYTVSPEYPMAEKLCNNYICLPINATLEVPSNRYEIDQIIFEVDDD